MWSCLQGHGPQFHRLGANQQAIAPKVAPVENRKAWCKPAFGFWTSSFVNGQSDWMRWCEDEEFSIPDDRTWRGVLLTPHSNAKLACVDTYADLESLVREYGCPKGYRDEMMVDFEKLALDFDGMHLTERGQWATRMTHPLDLYGWDCESTVWFKWAFEETNPPIISVPCLAERHPVLL